MAKNYSLAELKQRELAILVRLYDPEASKGAKRHNKRALARIRKQIKEKE